MEFKIPTLDLVSFKPKPTLFATFCSSILYTFNHCGNALRAQQQVYKFILMVVGLLASLFLHFILNVKSNIFFFFYKYINIVFVTVRLTSVYAALIQLTVFM